MSDNSPTSFRSFAEFYPYYLSEHRNRTSRRLHVIGTGLVIIFIFLALFSGRGVLWVLVPIVGYGFAWVGHFFFEKNRPATFRHPIYSLMGDFAMFRDVMLGRLPF